MNHSVAADISIRPHPLTAVRHWAGIYSELVKARLASLVIVTTIVGYLVATVGSVDWAKLALTVVGTALAAAAANSLNQVIEVRRDALMPRTRHRPLPSGRMSIAHAVVAAIAFAGFGVTLLAAFVNLLTAALAALTIALYLLAYTPLKTRSTMNTLVGAVCGAIPPMMGWTAAAGSLDTGAWLLGVTLFIWQIPHFLALAWLYRHDYELGGYRMLPVIDPTGAITTTAVVMWSLALLPLGLTAAMAGVGGWVFVAASVALGVWFMLPAIRLWRGRMLADARRLFLASIVYLPLLLGSLVVDHYVSARRPAAMERGPVILLQGQAQPVTPLAPMRHPGT